MRICLLASGSKGNAVYVEAARQRILIDAGLSGREIQRRLGQIGVGAGDLDAILVSHEHGDHCRGLGVLARRHKLPVYIHPQTRQVLPDLHDLPTVREFAVGELFSIGALNVQPFPTTHDAVASVGYTLRSDEGKVGLATDLGLATRLVADHLQGCRALIVETNHDEDLLRDGPYPWPLKQRIRSRHGHLSNRDAAALVKDVAWPGLEAVFLAHLSDTNNHPDLALEAVQQALHGLETDPQLILGYQDRISHCFQTDTPSQQQLADPDRTKEPQA